MFQQVVGQVCRTIDRRGSAARQRGCKKGFRGKYHARTMKTNQRKIGVTACNQGRYTDWRPNLLHGMSTAVFVGSRTVDSLLPPACRRWLKKVVEKRGRSSGGKPFVQGWTHTHTPTHNPSRLCVAPGSGPGGVSKTWRRQARGLPGKNTNTEKNCELLTRARYTCKAPYGVCVSFQKEVS